jgi:hypothetical protein
MPYDDDDDDDDDDDSDHDHMSDPNLLWLY